MHMRIVEAGQQQLATGVNHFGVGTAPQINLRARADGDNPVADRRHRIRFGVLFINRIDICVGDNQCRCRPRLGGRD